MNRLIAWHAVTALTAGLTATLLATPALATTPPTGAVPDPGEGSGKLVLLMDSSGSMAEADGAGDPKIEAARAALTEIIGGLGDEQQVGLRVFGANELGTSNPAACTDSDLVVPIGSGNQAALQDAVTDYEPFGETPIGYALQEAGKDLGGEGQRSILLVSDGIATCDPDPCEVAADLSEDGVDLVIHVVGFDVDEQAREQLRCIADAGNGQYVDAQDTESLTSALEQVTTRAFRPFAVSGQPVVGTPTLDGAPTLVEGQFTDTMPINREIQKHYLLPRSAVGSTVHVGVTMRPKRGGLGSYLLRLATAEGRSCDVQHASPWSAGAGNSFGTAAVNSGGSRHDPCAEAEQLILTVGLQGGSEELQDGIFEMVVVEEPPVTNASDLPGQAPSSEWQDMEPGEPVAEVVAGSSLNGATPIEADRTYASELTRGEIVFFRVPVQHGQRLQALVEFPEPSGAFAETTRPTSDIADVVIIGPTRGNATEYLARTGDLHTRASIQPGPTARAVATAPEVRFANHSSSNRAGASMAGDYWVGVSMTSSHELTVPIPFTLTTQLIGDPSGAPEYAVPSTADDTSEATAEDAGAGAEDSAEESADDSSAGPAADEATGTDPTTDPAAAPPVDAPDSGGPSGLALGLGALGLALLGAGGVVLAKVLRS